MQGIQQLLATVEIVRVQDIQLQGAKDELILEWAATRDFVLLTHDARTMIRHGRERIEAGMHFPGMIVIRRITGIGRILRELEVLIACTRDDEWENNIWFVPF